MAQSSCVSIRFVSVAISKLLPLLAAGSWLYELLAVRPLEAPPLPAPLLRCRAKLPLHLFHFGSQAKAKRKPIRQQAEYECAYEKCLPRAQERRKEGGWGQARPIEKYRDVPLRSSLASSINQNCLGKQRRFKERENKLAPNTCRTGPTACNASKTRKKIVLLNLQL